MFEKDDVLKFINDFKSNHKEEIEDLFTNGYCYYFALILDHRFYQGGTILYIPVYNHFCYNIYSSTYDITGIITDKEKLELAVPWSSYKKKYPLESKRILRDCILKVDVDF